MGYVQVGKDKDVGYDPCSVAYFSNGEYICVGGTNRQVGLVTKEGTRLTNISQHEAWCASLSLSSPLRLSRESSATAACSLVRQAAWIPSGPAPSR